MTIKLNLSTEDVIITIKMVTVIKREAIINIAIIKNLDMVIISIIIIILVSGMVAIKHPQYLSLAIYLSYFY